MGFIRYDNMTNEEFVERLSKYMIDGCHPRICTEAADRLAKAVFLPCNIDDEVWFLYRLTEKYGGTHIVKAEVVRLNYSTVGQMSQWWLQIVYDDINGHQDVTEALLGKTVFLTREEAEQSLRKEDEKNG